MNSPPKGIYVVEGGRVVRVGRRDREARTGEDFHAITDPVQRALLRQESDDLQNIRWNGAAVVRRGQPEIDARLRNETIAADDAYFERKQLKAIVAILLDEINILRQRAGLTPRTVPQAKNAYKRKLNR